MGQEYRGTEKAAVPVARKLVRRNSPQTPRRLSTSTTMGDDLLSDGVVASEVAIWIGLAAASGVTGNIAYDLIKELVRRAASQRKWETLAVEALDEYCTSHAIDQWGDWDTVITHQTKQYRFFYFPWPEAEMLAEVSVPNVPFRRLDGHYIDVRLYHPQAALESDWSCWLSDVKPTMATLVETVIAEPWFPEERREEAERLLLAINKCGHRPDSELIVRMGHFLRAARSPDQD